MSAHWSMSVYTLGPRSGCHDDPSLGLSWLAVARCGQRRCTFRPTAGHRPSAALFDRRLHAGTAAEMGAFVRGHWGIENGLHWVLDVVFREDDCRVRAGYAGENLALIRRV